MTSHLLMIEPVAFGFNEETAANNYFQQKDGQPAATIQQKAYKEFCNMVELLRSKEIDVVAIADTQSPYTPDSIFPNNWVSFHEDGRVALYPMFAVNRRAERRMDILEQLQEYGFTIAEIIDFTAAEQQGRYLEGTGSMVLDRDARIAYAALSERTDSVLFHDFCAEFDYQPCAFHALQSVEGGRLPIYHTNVMMCVADRYAVVCFDSIDDNNERSLLREMLEKSGKEQIISLTEVQMHHFAGNMLQVKSIDGNPYLVLSQSAYNILTDDQKNIMGKYNELLPVDIATIEQYGGGSARCMIAEIYNPKH